MELRDYQHEAINAALEADARGVRRPAIVLPTGSGKTVIFSAITRAHLDAGKDGSVYVLVHRNELARQAREKLMAWGVPRDAIGTVKAELDEWDRPVVVASVATLSRAGRLSRVPRSAVGRAIVDECHHATAPGYRRILEHFEGAHALGVTATMDRGDGVALGTKRGGVWDEIVYERDVIWMIRRGWLADVEGISVKVESLDLSTVRTSAGDYRDGDLDRAMVDSQAPAVVAREYPARCRRPDGSLRPALLFAPGVASAKVFDAHLRAAGVRSGVIHGETPLAERERMIADYESGELDVLCNCMVLTEGFDSPRAEVCILARPTSSAPLYVQIVGRVLRPFPGKERALVLDVTGTAGRFALATLADLGGAAPKPPKPGQSVLEALEEQEAQEVSSLLTSWHAGPVHVEAIDLFGGSRQQWLRTGDGHWVLPAGERYLVIHPDEGWKHEPDAPLTGPWAVAWYSVQPPRQGESGGGWVARQAPDLSVAMGLAEANVSVEETVLSRKEGRWRRNRPRRGQVDYAISLGVIANAEEGLRMTAGALGDLMSAVKASHRCDATIGNWMRVRRLGTDDRLGYARRKA